MSKPTREAFGNAAQGVTRLGLTLHGIKSVLIPVPDLNTQKAIADYLDAATAHVDEMILKAGGKEAAKFAKANSLLALLTEKRAALITAVVAGQIDIEKKLPAIPSQPDRTKFRVVVAAEIIQRHQGNAKFGRVKVHKLIYLAETHLGINGLQGNYLREAAGPLDPALREETERGLEMAGYYRAKQTDGTGTAVTYTPLAKAGQHKAELNALLGSKANDLRKLIATLADLDRRQTEAVVTLYAVWNDALLDGQYGASSEAEFFKQLEQALKQRGALDVLRNGVKLVPNLKFFLCAFRPASAINPALVALFQANILSVIRQVRYSSKSENAIDVGLFVNSLPVATLELKNTLTGQNFRHAERQYRHDRAPANEPLLTFKRGPWSISRWIRTTCP